MNMSLFLKIYCNKVADLFLYIFGNKAQIVPVDLHIGFHGLALIQAQIYNPV